MEPDNLEPFVIHAEFVLEFRCKICGEVMHTDGINQKIHTDSWYNALAERAAREGWVVVNEWDAIGPECNAKKV